MNTKSGFESVKEFFQKIGRRNLVIAGAVTLIVAAVAVNWVIFKDDGKDDGFQYDASAGMNTNYGTTMGTTSVEDDANQTVTQPEGDSYFSSASFSFRFTLRHSTAKYLQTSRRRVSTTSYSE